MNTLTQTLKRRQAIVKYAKRYGVSKSSTRYNVSRPTIYKWMKRYDGHLGSLKDESRKPHHHAKQHTEAELEQIRNMRRRNPNAGIVVLWVKLRRKGYSRSISGLLKVLKSTGQMAVKLPNPKYTPKPYEKMQYPGQRVQIDVKYVPNSCLVGAAAAEAAETGGYFQYTFIDEYSRFRYLEAFKEHNTYSSSEFIKHCVKRFPYAIECVQTDNGSEFTNRRNAQCSDKETLFERTLRELGIRHKLIKPYTPRHNGKVERSHRKDNEYFYVKNYQVTAFNTALYAYATPLEARQDTSLENLLRVMNYNMFVTIDKAEDNKAEAEIIFEVFQELKELQFIPKSIYISYEDSDTTVCFSEWQAAGTNEIYAKLIAQVT